MSPEFGTTKGLSNSWNQVTFSGLYLYLQCPLSEPVLSFNQSLFQYVTGIMKRGYQEEERSRRHHIVVSAKERPDKKNTALWSRSAPETVSPKPQQGEASRVAYRCVYTVFIISLFGLFLSFLLTLHFSHEPKHKRIRPSWALKWLDEHVSRHHIHTHI